MSIFVRAFAWLLAAALALSRPGQVFTAVRDRTSLAHGSPPLRVVVSPRIERVACRASTGRSCQLSYETVGGLAGPSGPARCRATRPGEPGGLPVRVVGPSA